MDNRKTIQTIFNFALLGLMFALLIGMLYPFFTIILWTIFLYILINPLHSMLLKKLNKDKKFYQTKRHALAGVFSLGTLLVIIVPLVSIGILLTNQLLSFVKSVESFIMNNPDFFSQSETGIILSKAAEKLSLNFINLSEINIRENLIDFLQKYSSRIIGFGTSIISSAGNFVVSILFVAFALYFCFLDGRYLTTLLKKAVPIDPSYMSALSRKFTQITKHLFSGYILVALYQGTAAFIIMLIFRIEGALLFSVILMFCSFIPIFGAAIVWVPMGIVLCFTSSVLQGIIFLILCGFCVSFLDNFLRPFFLKDRINVHPLIIFFSILGGLKVFGINGLLLGPMVVIMFFTVLDLMANQNEIQINAE